MEIQMVEVLRNVTVLFIFLFLRGDGVTESY